MKEDENSHIFFSIAVHEHDLSSPPQEPLIVLLKKRLPKLRRKKDAAITIKVKNNSINNFKLKYEINKINNNYE